MYQALNVRVRRRLLVSTALGILVTLLVAACSPGGTTSTSGAPATAPVAAAPTIAPAAAPTVAPAPSPAPTVARTIVFQTRDDATLGKILADMRGMTLYTFTRDTAGVSNCNDACAQTWPPLAAPAGELAVPTGLTGTLTTITRADGNKQIAYNGLPLYTYRQDTAPGETKGQGVGGVWFVAKP